MLDAASLRAGNRQVGDIYLETHYHQDNSGCSPDLQTATVRLWVFWPSHDSRVVERLRHTETTIKQRSI